MLHSFNHYTQVRRADLPVFFDRKLLDFVLDSFSGCSHDDALQKQEVVLVKDLPFLEWADNLQRKVTTRFGDSVSGIPLSDWLTHPSITDDCSLAFTQLQDVAAISGLG